MEINTAYRPNRANRLAIWLISFYQKISFMLPSHCIYAPTCSCYAKEAFLKHSFFKAFRLSVSRILRCHPLAKGGFDPLENTDNYR
ncbi:MAG: membrane protein insertion efficiency factor YidD [Candidatus Omnitrophota bacterium]